MLILSGTQVWVAVGRPPSHHYTCQFSLGDPSCYCLTSYMGCEAKGQYIWANWEAQTGTRFGIVPYKNILVQKLAPAVALFWYPSGGGH